MFDPTLSSGSDRRARPLADHRLEVERRARAFEQRRQLAQAFGIWIAYWLASWDWFLTITFRGRDGKDLPSPDLLLREVKGFLAELEQAGQQVGWVLAEEFGAVTGRFHCHCLVAGVALLVRRAWWLIAYQRFGRSRIEPVRLQQAAAFYAAKYQTKQLGMLHFGGFLAGLDLSAWERSQKPTPGGRQVVAPSADVPTLLFHLTAKNRRRNRCRPNAT